MELEYAFFAKFVELAPDGSFSVFGGGLNTLKASAFPAQWPMLYLLARLKGPPEMLRGEHPVKFDLLGPDGAEQPLVLETTLPNPSPDLVRVGDDGRVGANLAVGVINYPFPGPGRYTFRIWVDGRQVGTLPFSVEADEPKGGGT